MLKKHYFVVGLLLLLGSLFADDLDDIYQEALKLKEARLQENYEAILNCTHPAVLKKIGGKERVLKLIKKQQAKQNQSRLVDYQITRPTKVHRNEQLAIAILEVQMKLEKDGKVQEGNSFLIAVMDKNLGKKENDGEKANLDEAKPNKETQPKEETVEEQASPDKWYFISGGGVSDEETLKRFFPELPTGIVFPKKSSEG